MQQSPARHTCGWELRWLAEQNTWGCDRCRVMVPSSPAAFAPTTAPRRGGKPLLWIGIAVAVAGVITAVVARGAGSGGGRASGRATSTKEAIERTFRALGAGDAEALLAGASPATLKTAADCSSVDTDAERREVEDLRKELTRAAEREKGATFEVLDVREVRAERLGKGAKLGKRCTARYDIVGHVLEVKLKVTRDGGTEEVTSKTTVTEVNGAFLVLNAPQLGGCSGAVARAMLIGERDGRKASKYDVARCRREQWTPAQIDCMSNAILSENLDRCLDGAAGYTPPPECIAWTATLDKLKRCPALEGSEFKKSFVDTYDRAADFLSGKVRKDDALLATMCAQNRKNAEGYMDGRCDGAAGPAGSAAERTKGAGVSEACLANPLAKGCP
jgi:hypothetical protein